MIKNYKLSFIIPSLAIPDELFELLRQVHSLSWAEVILINQSGKSICPNQDLLNLTEVCLDKPVCASTARNIGARISKAEYLMFLDDDALFFNNSYKKLKKMLEMDEDCFIVNKGYISNKIFISSNPQSSKWKPSHWSAIQFVIEWNICVRRKLFFSSGEFPEIGPGSSHSALCGEAFILFSHLFRLTKKIVYFDSIQISHPPFWGSKSLKSCYGYYYGAGYAVGKGLAQYSFWYKYLWYLRTFFAPLRDFFIPSRFILTPNDDDISNIDYRVLIARARVLGLYDGIFKKNPRLNIIFT